jgi:hypothetical protein
MFPITNTYVLHLKVPIKSFASVLYSNIPYCGLWGGSVKGKAQSTLGTGSMFLVSLT